MTDLAENEPCVQCDNKGCPYCDDDIAYCDSCGEAEPYNEFNDDMICLNCRESAKADRQLASDYRYYVLGA
jgi:hypothetical protein